MYTISIKQLTVVSQNHPEKSEWFFCFSIDLFIYLCSMQLCFPSIDGRCKRHLHNAIKFFAMVCHTVPKLLVFQTSPSCCTSRVCWNPLCTNSSHHLVIGLVVFLTIPILSPHTPNPTDHTSYLEKLFQTSPWQSPLTNYIEKYILLSIYLWQRDK